MYVGTLFSIAFAPSSPPTTVQPPKFDRQSFLFLPDLFAITHLEFLFVLICQTTYMRPCVFSKVCAAGSLV